MIQCKVCGKQTKNKVYCSEICQYSAYRGKLSANRVKCNCLSCGKEFEVKEYDITLGRGKYCSKKCYGLHLKKAFLGDGNPAFGSHMTEENKKIHSEIASAMWKSEEYREKINNGIRKFVEKNGHFPGTDTSSILKKKATCIEKYGADHNWKNVENRQKCEDTCIKKYGKSSVELMNAALFKKKITKPESIILEILERNNINYIRNYKIYYTPNTLRCKIYDFVIMDKRILLEADGDYWHANPKFYTELNETQNKNKLNDMFKNELAKAHGFKLIRFWENEIKEVEFETKLLAALYE